MFKRTYPAVELALLQPLQLGGAVGGAAALLLLRDGHSLERLQIMLAAENFRQDGALHLLLHLGKHLVQPVSLLVAVLVLAPRGRGRRLLVLENPFRLLRRRHSYKPTTKRDETLIIF